MNRLKLDFSLETAEERKNFIDTYIVQFPDLTNSEAETIADYLLWGKTEEGVALGADTNLKSRWNKNDDVDSLESILENPALANLQIKALNEATLIKKPRVVFDREEVRKNAPAYLVNVFEDLWRNIDEIDLLINFYELEVGKRDKPPRSELLRRFTDEEQTQLKEKAKTLNQYTYLKKRHQLVELRKEQFTLQDSYKTTFNLHQSIYGADERGIAFDAEIEVLPLGLCTSQVGQLIFRPDFDPGALNEQQLKAISDLVWSKKDFDGNSFDFRDLEAVYQLYLFKEDFIDQNERNKTNHSVEANLSDLLQTLNFYESIADLTEIQIEILRRKERKEKNSDIADFINKTYGKSYTANYISTIFRQKIIGKINEAAKLHQDTVENCFFPENFKKCTECGRILLLDGRNWVRKARSKDGFQNRCKRCEREMRKNKQK